MIHFDVNRYEKTVNGALSLVEKIQGTADDISKKGFSNIYLIGCGGTYSHALSLKYMINTISGIEVNAVIAAEFVLMNDKRFNKDSLCIFSSRTGTTKEIVKAAYFCKNAGARVIAFVSNANTPLCDVADDLFINFAEDDNLAESIYLQNIPFLFRLAYNRGEFCEYDEFIEQLKKITPFLLKAKESIDNTCRIIAEEYKDENYHMVVGSGNLWGEAYDYSMCILEEMQWIRTRAVHAAEFFHGALELVEPGVSIILFYGEDETRILMERVYDFACKYTGKIIIFDTKTAELPLEEKFRKYVSPIVIYAMTERLSMHLSNIRNHPLTTRRYYNQMEY